MNFLLAGIPLFRVFRIQVVLSWLFLIYAGFMILSSRDPVAEVITTFLVFGIVLLHEFGHCLACRAVKGNADHIVLWPLGGLAFCNPPNEKFAHLVTTIGGPLVNVILIPVFIGLQIVLHASPVHIHAVSAAARWAAEMNWYILIFNLLPIYPLDGGRIFQEIMWYIVGYQRSLMIAGMVGTVGGVGFIVLGLGLASVTIPFYGSLGGYQNNMLLGIGIMAATSSFAAYQRSQEIRGWRKR
jgi:Zn-dependent protease